MSTCTAIMILNVLVKGNWKAKATKRQKECIVGTPAISWVATPAWYTVTYSDQPTPAESDG